jgi:hypothetical protein
MPYEMQSNQEAQITARYEIDIFAPMEKVWDWLSRVEMWPSWRHDVTSAYWVNGEGANGTIKWRIRKMLGFTAYVTAWRSEREMRWEAVSYRTQISHVLRLSGDYRQTIVTLDIRGSGGFLKFPIARSIFSHYFNNSNEIWLGALKTKLKAGKEDSMMPPVTTRNPFEGNVKLQRSERSEDR